MPAFEMGLGELKEYKGTNPKPSDFDSYWDNGLNELKTFDWKVELIPSKFQVNFADCFHLYFTGVKGARIHAKYLRPKAVTEPHPAIIEFHGYSVNSGDWSDKLNYVALGYSYVALDCRGQGGLSEDVGGVKGNTLHGHIIKGLDDKPEQLLYRQIFLDTAQLAKIIMSFPEVDEDRVGTRGASQGGALTVACAALEPRIKKAAPVYPFLSDYKRVWDMDLAKNAYEGITEYFRRFDPRHERENEVFEILGYIDIQNLASRIKADVLWGIGLMDTICPPSTQFAAYNKLNANKRMTMYYDYGHEHIPQLNDEIFNFLCKL
ncbi:MAG: acetylxylan esterase [Eubacteriales bacterium]